MSDPRYYWMHLEELNIVDLNQSIEDDDLLGIVDEVDGGIIAYAIGLEHAQRIVNALEKL